jgi:prephenate dehydrogenase
VAEVREAIPEALATTDVAKCVRGVSMAILCMPVQHMAAVSEQMAAAELSEDLIITDVGSVKASVVAELEPLFSRAQRTFIGSHPMAGSERTGLANAKGDLFQRAACILTPTSQTPAPLLDRLRAFWLTMGCRIQEMSPEQHDRRVARISHLPHSMAVVTTLAALSHDPSVLESAAGGFRDTTRVAGGDPAMWAGILLNNRTEIMGALQDVEGRLRELLEILQTMDEEALRRFLTQAKGLRDLLPAV